MTYTYTAFVYFTNSITGKWEDPDPAPTVSAISGEDGSVISGPTITKLTTGIYRIEVADDEFIDVLFLVHTDDADFPDTLVVYSAYTASLPESIWGYSSRTLTQTLTQVAEMISNSSITAYRGNTWELGVVLGVDVTGGNIQFAIKTNVADTDAEALLFVDTDTGLITVNGVSAVDPTDAEITINDLLTGDITIRVEAGITAELSSGRKKYGIQLIDSVNDVSEVSIGTFLIIDDVVNTSI